MNSSRPPELIWTFNQSKKTRPGPIQNLTLEPLVCPKPTSEFIWTKTFSPKEQKSPSLIKNLTSEQKCFAPNLNICAEPNQASSSKGEYEVAKKNKILQQIFVTFLHFWNRAKNWRTEFISPLSLFPLTTTLCLTGRLNGGEIIRNYFTHFSSED